MTVSTTAAATENVMDKDSSNGMNENAYRLSIRYESKYGQHSDDLYIQHANLPAVIEMLPAAISNDLNSSHKYVAKTYDYIRGKLFNNDDQVQSIAIAQEDFIRHPGHNIDIEPRFGRFYPVTLFNSEKLAMFNRMLPVRVIDLMYKDILVNTSHPLSDYNTTLTIDRFQLQQPAEHETEPLLDIKQVPDFLTGPGMQLRYDDRATDFFSDDPFERSDDNSDSDFYFQARHIDHLDETALKQLKTVYSKLIPENSEILDLMSSINSHIDNMLVRRKVIGLGMNAEELSANQFLDEIIVHDINQESRLPFDDASFDVVICSLSIEYITQPSSLFDEVARILRAGGRFIISFSNRWFPSKAVKVWNNLHDFERIGLVMEYFIASAHFRDINTWSVRGIPRPASDRHNIPLSDPLYVVWADRE